MIELINNDIIEGENFIQQVTNHTSKEYFNFDHRNLMNLIDLYERTMEEVCYSWSDMKNIVTNSYNSVKLNKLRLDTIEKTSVNFYDRGRKIIYKETLKRYETIFLDSKLALYDMGFETSVVNGKITFKGNTNYTSTDLSFDERWQNLLFSIKT